jgi:hypothetical protein
MSEAGKAFPSKSNTTDPWGSSLNPAWTSCRVEQDNKKNTQQAVRRKLLTGNRSITSWFSKFAAIIAPSKALVSPFSQFPEDAFLFLTLERSL